jgi:hypothetical protein
VIDYWQCQHEVLCDALLHFCGLVKENWPRPIITGVFYGYTFSQFGRQAAGGHLEIARVLRSPFVDYLSAPQTYQPYSREIGGTGMPRGLPESCALHGKLWLDEMDQPTHLGCVGDKTFTCTLPDAVSLLRRNVAQPLMRGHGLWYYDFGPRFSSGWWDDPALISEIRRMKDMFDARVDREWESPADVLMLCDLETFYHTGSSFRSDPLSEPALDQCASAIYRSGVCFHTAWLCDLDLIDWSRYRAVVLANAWVLSPAQRALLRERAAAGNRHLVWVYAPGYSDGARLCTTFMEETTGMTLELVDLPAAPDAPGLSSPGRGVTPLFAPADAQAETISVFEGTDVPAVARKALPGHTAWFCSLPPVEPDLLRAVFRASGAHIYSDAADVIFCGLGLLCVHTLAGGSRAITLRSGREITAELAPRSTTFFDAETGARVLD